MSFPSGRSWKCTQLVVRDGLVPNVPDVPVVPIVPPLRISIQSVLKREVAALSGKLSGRRAMDGVVRLIAQYRCGR